MKILLVLSAALVVVWAKPRDGKSSPVILNDPPKPPTPSPPHQLPVYGKQIAKSSPKIMNDPPKPPPPPPPHANAGNQIPYSSPRIMNDPPKPPPPPPPHKLTISKSSPTILNDPPKPPPPPPPHNPEALIRRTTDDGHLLWEGDMVLTQEQVDSLYGPISTRKAINDVNKRWTNGQVPFAISQSSAADRASILAGLQHWMDNSCIRFTEVPLGSAFPHLIFKKLGGCYSSVGMQYYQNGQDISIGQGCTGMGTIAHEVGHALGFWHEQSRPDRKNYVKLLEANINQTMKYNFDIQNDIDSYGVPYDLNSLMHYGLDYFTVNGRNTMVPKNIHDTFKIGQRNGLSFYDLKLAHIMYNCNAQCASKPNCQNEGFVDHTCKCRCPPGFSGQLCQNRVNLPGPKCGGDYSSPMTISTPNFPQKYEAGDKCIWVFQAPAGKQVKAAFRHFDLIQHNEVNGACSWDSVEIRTNDVHDGLKFCARDLHKMALTSDVNQMAILFHAEYDWNTGFEADITFV